MNIALINSTSKVYKIGYANCWNSVKSINTLTHAEINMKLLQSVLSLQSLHIVIWFIVTLIASPLLLAEDDEGSDDVIYVPLQPAIITNYQSKRLSYVKADLSLQVRGNSTAEAIDRHLPSIRHNLVMLFSRQDEGALATMEGKSKLKDDALAAVISALEAEGEPTSIEAILFTSFIVE